MKAQQIAPAVASVFAIDQEGQVRFIERGAEGFWGRWQSTGISGRRVVHGGSIVATLGLDDRVSALQRSADGSWVTWDRRAIELCAIHAPGRGPLLLANDGDSIWHVRKQAPSAPWSEWARLDGPITDIGAAVLPGGRPALFGIHNGTVRYRLQEGGQAWTEWARLGAPAGGATALRVTTLSGGGLAAFATGGDGRLSHRWQVRPYGDWHPWQDLGGPVQSFSVTKTPKGGLAIFAVGDGGQVRWRFQQKPFAEWSPWLDLDGEAASVTAQISYTDGLEVFAIGVDGEVYHKWCERLDWPWTGWVPLDFEASPLRILPYGSSTSLT